MAVIFCYVINIQSFDLTNKRGLSQKGGWGTVEYFGEKLFVFNLLLFLFAIMGVTEGCDEKCEV
ncbi:hypothetical protein BSQ40_04230 [Serratia fonticola]|nr:hypothetical protein BSQ40_04230 [Serratia fonticola]